MNSYDLKPRPPLLRLKQEVIIIIILHGLYCMDYIAWIILHGLYCMDYIAWIYIIHVGIYYLYPCNIININILLCIHI